LNALQTPAVVLQLNSEDFTRVAFVAQFSNKRFSFPERNKLLAGLRLKFFPSTIPPLHVVIEVSVIVKDLAA
jgi:hypothetical protein